jgi:hypothetical protein
MAKDATGTAEIHEGDFFLFSGLKAHGCASRNVQTHPMRSFAIEIQRAVYFKEVKVTAYLNGPVARVPDQDGRYAAIGVGYDLA